MWSLLAAAAAAPAIAGCGSEAERAGFEVLVFSRTTAYRHAEAIEAGRAALEAMGAERGFAVESTERLPDLDGVEVVVLLQTNGEGVIQRQLGHSNLGFPSVYLQRIDSGEIIETVHARRAPMIPVSASLRL